mmetsp:Transcript_60763/g.107970  ORF Transcript_60763/g.107970 Transcript_60763/m.107970 type:complete len:797 (+) Transcript_60763:120-2510(+)
MEASGEAESNVVGREPLELKTATTEEEVVVVNDEEEDDTLAKSGGGRAPEDSRAPAEEHKPKWFIVYANNRWRVRWNLIVCLMLVYIATIFPFRYTFIESHVPNGMKAALGWKIIEGVIDVLFWIDLIVNFFFTYTRDGEEVDDLCMIVKNYLKGFFIWNLVACLPAEVFAPIVESINSHVESGSETSGHKLTRMTRLQRITRLARLTRIGRLAVLFRVENSELWNWLKGTRGMRIINFVGFLLWVVHLLACGWYLTAVWHDEPELTWLWRREVDHTGKRLLDEPPFVQWAHAMYFVLTVFTTVGFGDMSAWTVGEIFYVSLTMLCGVVVNSIIVGEVINIVGTMDGRQMQLRKTKEVIDGFCTHCHLQRNMREQMMEWIENLSYKADFEKGFDRDAMRDLITSGSMPHKLLKLLPVHVFAGRLHKHKFITNSLTHSSEVPPRLTLLLALSLSVRIFQDLEVVYQLHDNPFNVFLVDAGVFAYVGKPQPAGGEDEPAATIGKIVSAAHEQKALQVTDALRKVKQTISKRESWSSPQEKPEENEKHTWVVHQRAMHLHPYQLFCQGSYFGEFELLEASVRHETARCEGRAGGQGRSREPTLLVLHKPDYYRLIDEFPHIANAWITKAAAREQRRLERRHNMTEARSYQNLAAFIIQRYVRAKAQGLKTAKSGTKSLSNINSDGDNGGRKAFNALQESANLQAAYHRSGSASAGSNSFMLKSYHQGKRRRMGGVNSQMEERGDDAPIGDDTWGVRAMMQELKQDMKQLARSVAELRGEVAAQGRGMRREVVQSTEGPI